MAVIFVGVAESAGLRGALVPPEVSPGAMTVILITFGVVLSTASDAGHSASQEMARLIQC